MPFLQPENEIVLTLLGSTLSLTGLVISAYFTAISARWIRPDEGWLPSFCHLGESTCTTIVFTPRARLFGVPNSVLGVVWYLALLMGLLTGLVGVYPWRLAYLAASLVTVVVGAYLTYSLLFITRVPCRLCFTSHAINLALLVLLLSL